ncbi:putative secreted protein (plasmid) [Rhizobium favelukesii]|uniref:Secreted protein n=1 Tax=Rhizobium favelukesii TaxID=348824 RepID=W6RWZ3_9HYPH|nr:putative secreted protein [Rhizobium favelukesii]
MFRLVRLPVSSAAGSMESLPLTSVWKAPFIGCYSRLSKSDFLASNS